MARQSSLRGGTSRIRFIMLDAEIPKGDLTQITAAIQNALKPATINQPRLPSQPTHSTQITDARVNGANGDEDAIEVADEVPEVDGLPRKPRGQRQRKPSNPKVLDDIDLESGVSFADYVQQYPPKTDRERNLVVAAYFKDHRPDQEGIAVDHVYTCYRAMEWPTSIPDFSGSLRHLKRDQLVTRPQRGTYVINHLGLAAVYKLRNGVA